MSGILVTTLDLYRIGTVDGPGVVAVRPGIDISVRLIDGVDWVSGTPDGGVSLRSSAWPLRRSTSRWWRLPIGTPYSGQLAIRNDHGHHWLVEPATGMPLGEYRALLRALGAFFV